LIVVKRICNAQRLEIFKSLALRASALVDPFGDFFLLGVVLGVLGIEVAVEFEALRVKAAITESRLDGAV